MALPMQGHDWEVSAAECGEFMTSGDFVNQFPRRLGALFGNTPEGARHDLEDSQMSHAPAIDDLNGAKDADFLAIGLGGTNMMAMLWTVAMGRRAVGVELRGDPALGVHWNIREDLYHHFGLIDEMMLDRYGEEGVPKRSDGLLYKLRDTFYSPDSEPGSHYTDEVISGFMSSLGVEAHTAGLIHHTEFIDDRWVDGQPNRSLTILNPPKPPATHSSAMVGRSIKDVLDGPSTFQIGASEALVMCRRYLELIEEMDLV